MNMFSERLKQARLQKSLRQTDVAEKLDCAATSLTNWESGKVQPPLDVLSRLCDVLEISALDLLEKRYTYNDILGIAQKPYKERSYEEQIALNFSGSILETVSDKELLRLEKERENKDYISETIGLTAPAVEALITDSFDFIEEDDEDKITPAGLEALNKLLSSKEGLAALENIAIYLRAGDFRFADNIKVVRVEIGTFDAPGRSVKKFFSLAPDMTNGIIRDELLRNLDALKTRLPQEEIAAAVESFRDDLKKRRG
jgi:transcriptional regulator with XRE-family HTH domain